jgi:hypothetical protein
MNAGTAFMFWVMLPVAMYLVFWSYDRGRS